MGLPAACQGGPLKIVGKVLSACQCRLQQPHGVDRQEQAGAGLLHADRVQQTVNDCCLPAGLPAVTIPQDPLLLQPFSCSMCR